MTADGTDPFGRPIETEPPIILTEDEARKRMADVAVEEKESAEDLTKRLDEERAFEIAVLEASVGEDLDEEEV